MGHNFGLRHVNGPGFIMSATSSPGDGGNWSASTVAAFDGLVTPSSTLACLDDAYVERTGPFCGDGIVEGGEECDPGISTADACCTGCALVSGCVCATTDPCCTSAGAFSPQGATCRAATDSTCDTAEVCSGSTSTCPQDAVTLAGVDCVSSPAGGKCYNGGCHAPMVCDWSADYPTFYEPRRGTCQSVCVNVQGTSISTRSPPIFGPDGTPCGDGRQCSTAGANSDAGERCVTSATLNAGFPTAAPSPAPPTRLPTTAAPATSVPTSAPNSLPTYSGIVCGQTVSGTTVDGANTIGRTANDVVYTFTLSQATTITFDGCQSRYDSFLSVLDNGGSMVSEYDDGCPPGDRGDRYATKLAAREYDAGLYMLVVEGFSESSVGDFVVQMHCDTDEPTTVPTTAAPSSRADAEVDRCLSCIARGGMYPYGGGNDGCEPDPSECRQNIFSVSLGGGGGEGGEGGEGGNSVNFTCFTTINDCDMYRTMRSQVSPSR